MAQEVFFIVTRYDTKDWIYKDPQESKSHINTIETMAKLISKISAAFQHCDDKDEQCYFEISIKKGFIKIPVVKDDLPF